MGEFGSWVPLQFHDRRPPDPYDLGAHALSGSGQQSFISAYRNPGTSMMLTNGTLPVYAFSGLPHPQVGRANEPHRWFYCLPGVPATPSILKEMPIPCADPDNKQKRLLVSHPSGDQTSLAFHSGIVNPLRCPTSGDFYQDGAYQPFGNDHASNRDYPNFSGPILTDEHKGKDDSGTQSEMHEDTEELNALLYSDDESEYTEDDEVTSTGHSPSTLTIHDKQNWLDAREEEVASSCGVTKKRKLFYGGYDVPSIRDTASSKKQYRSSELEDDAESSYACHRISESRELDSLSSYKKMKKDKIRQTVRVLQNIIPGLKGKDAMVVLDEAILYLKSVQFEAKDFGLESF